MEDAERRYKDMGIVFWDKRRETKEQAKLRGLKAYKNYILGTKESIRQIHTEMVKAQKKDNIPEQSEYSYVYPKQAEHLERLPEIALKIKELYRKVS